MGEGRLGLITWDDDSPTGGNVYNEELVAALRAGGLDASLVRVGPGWPRPSEADRARLRAALAEWPVVLVDGIVAGNARDELTAARRLGARISVLVHLPLADEAGLPAGLARAYLVSERAALSAAHAVICPSRHTAARLGERYGRGDAVVAHPGAEVAAVAIGSTPPRLLSLGAVTPTKNQLALLAALAELSEQDWSLSLVGSHTAAPGYAADVRRRAAELGERVSMSAPLRGDELNRLWSATDLLVLCSRTETYGLVVTEALARGIPAIVPAGTGAVEALGEVDGLPPGRAVDPDELAATLRGWLTDPELRAEWRRRALSRRAVLPGWQRTAEIVRAAIG